MHFHVTMNNFSHRESDTTESVRVAERSKKKKNNVIKANSSDHLMRALTIERPRFSCVSLFGFLLFSL